MAGDFAPERARACESGVMIYDCVNMSQGGFFISLFVKAGILYESDAEWGITHFLEHIAIRNLNYITEGALYRDLDRYGLEFNAATYPEMVQFYITGAREHFDIGAKYISMLLEEIRLPREDIDKERLRIKAELREAYDRNSLSSGMVKIVYDKTPLGRGIMGSCGSLDCISGKRLEEYRKGIFTAENVFFYVTGCVEDSELSSLTQLVGRYNLAPSGITRTTDALMPTDFGNRHGVGTVKTGDYGKLRLQFDIDFSRVSYECLDLIYDILVSGYNSLLFSELSEKRGICYDVSGGVDRYSNIGSVFFQMELRDTRLTEAFELTLSLLHRLKTEPLSESECMKADYVDNSVLLYDDMRELNFTLATDNHILALGYGSLCERKSRYEAVSPEDIRRACAEIFQKKNLTVGIEGKRKNINLDETSRLVNKYL